jgi:magnesium chelatase subunit I
MNKKPELHTLGDLKAAGYQSKSLKQELRDNLAAKLRNKENVFQEIIGYDHTVIPDLQRAILSGHPINLLGLRGQAKTRLARKMTHLLDPYIPVVAGSELNDDPFQPLSRYAKDIIEEQGDATPIEWLHRDGRYVEKLATPDVSIADLIGDVDPIKAVNLKLNYNDERVIHFGLIPRANRSIFVINELPDLQPRIQVALFNILQEGDIQIRGFKLRLPLDIQFVFTANPEDYTNRGSIVTPLKDRIGSQIITHYPKSIEDSRSITKQEARISKEQQKNVYFNELTAILIERIAFEARTNEYVDAKSGVSARLTISAFENMISAAERRGLINGELPTEVRISDMEGVIPAITGKVEMVYEGEQEGEQSVARILLGKAIRAEFSQHFPKPGKSSKKEGQADPYERITNWFEDGHHLEIPQDCSDKTYARLLNSVDGLAALVDTYKKALKGNEKYLWMEFVLHGLAEYSKIGRSLKEEETHFGDLLGSMLG